MILDHNTVLQASMNANASASNNQTGYVAWKDIPVNAEQGAAIFPTYGAANITMNGTVVTTLVPQAPAGYMRVVTNFQLVNNDNATDALSLLRTAANNNNNNSLIYKATMLTLAQWVYIDGIGWKNQSAAGLSL